MTRSLPCFWWRPGTGTVPQRLLDAYHFRPGRPAPAEVGGLHRSLRNFGDELTPYLIRRLAPGTTVQHADMKHAELVCVGSVLQRALRSARPATVVAGSGLSGPVVRATDRQRARRLDLRFVRGHLTADVIGMAGHLPVGDPALALAGLPREGELRPSGEDVTLLLHYRLLARPDSAAVLDALRRRFGADAVVMSSASVADVLTAVSRSRLVVTTSLHGLIIGDALGVPAVAVSDGPPRPDFRFDDYASSLGRPPGHLPSIFDVDRAGVEAEARARARGLAEAVADRSAEVGHLLAQAVRDLGR